MMATQISHSTRNRRVFESVFGSGNISQPTPTSTPASQFSAPGQVFGVPESKLQGGLSQGPLPTPHLQPRKLVSLNVSSHVDDQVQWDRSWHIVTKTLAVPDFPEQRIALEALKPERESLQQEFYSALEEVICPQTCLPYARHTEDIVVWHTGQVRQHFLHQVLPVILRMRGQFEGVELVSKCVKVLETAHRVYFHGLSFIKEQVDVSTPETSSGLVERFGRDLHSVISNSVFQPLSTVLKDVFYRILFTALGLPLRESRDASGRDDVDVITRENSQSEQALRELLTLVQSLKNVGLAGERFQVIFAEIMNDAMTEYVYRGYKGVWSAEQANARFGPESRRSSTLPRMSNVSSPSRCVSDICEWIENRYAQIAFRVLNLLDAKSNVSWADKEKFKEMAIGRLAELRTHELFDIVENWQNSSGALDDLRAAITTPERRLHLTEVFATTLSKKLLHPGASTLQILRTYISMIWSFHALDQSKVLLDRVAYPLQAYLCSREDTVRIIISGLLSDTADSQGKPITTSKDRLVELAHLLNGGSRSIGRRTNDEELDWHDMEWIPDPVDAGPGYKRSKDADIIGTMIGVLGSQDVFIKEFQNIIGENLLRNDGAFEKEIKVLELLKVRFGEAPLQACEVMLKDIQDSLRVNFAIRRTQHLDPSEQEIITARQQQQQQQQTTSTTKTNTSKSISPEGILKPSLHAKILSRLFWPQLHDEPYTIPPIINQLQESYSHGFESLKSARKLTWLNTLGQATVELELEDRTVVEEVHTYQATVIYAFHSETDSRVGEGPLRLSVEELVERLGMEESLIRSALKFWSKKMVLTSPANSPNVYMVLETLSSLDRAKSKAQNSSGASSNNNRGDDGDGDDEGGGGGGKEKGMGREREAMYWSFIQGMLRNSKKEMGVGDISRMLKVLLPDGFPFGNEELGGFLGGKVEAGLLELKGGRYRLRK